MRKGRPAVLLLILVQIVAILLYPPALFRQYPQAAVLPPVLLVIFLLTLAGVYTRALQPLTGRISMVFTQGINMVMRVVMLFPNLKDPQGAVNGWLIVFSLVSIALSWIVVARIEKEPLAPPARPVAPR